MKKNTFIVLGLLFVVACTKSTDNQLFGIASPIQLGQDTTIVHLTDFFPEGIAIDSIKLDGPLSCRLDSNQLIITNQKNLNVELKPLQLLTIYSKGKSYDILLKKPTKQAYHFDLVLPNSYDDVRIKGEFNAWNQNALVLEKTENNHWIGTTYLTSGSFQYKLVADGTEIDDPNNKNSIGNGMGGTNSVLYIPGPPESEMPSLSTDKIENEFFSITGNNIENLYVFWNNSRIPSKQVDSKFQITIPLEAKKHPHSLIRIYGYNQHGLSNEVFIPLKRDSIVTKPEQLAKDDWHSSIMYFMMVDRFNDGKSSNNHPVEDSAILHKAQYWGGDIVGITEKINDGYFENLGINTIWISPIAQNPLDAWGLFNDPVTKFSGYHGYWPISSTSVDFRFGNKEEVEQMLEAAHQRGMKVILDYVANHVHQQHPVYQDHPDWVTPLYLPDGTLNTEKWDEHRLTTWFDTFMPSLNLMDQKVTDYMVDSALFWVKEYDFDGFRHDATKHIPENFWRTLTKKVKLVSKSNGKYLYQIGETYGTHELINSYVNSGMLDGQFDFNLYDNALPVFATEDASFDRLSSALKASLKTYGNHHLMGNITGNQDKPRFISYADGSLSLELPGMEYKRIGWKQTIDVADEIGYKRLAMFHAFNMTIPGIPVIYYGDEIGMPGAGDPDNRRMMRFAELSNEEQGLRNVVSDLIETRKSNMAFLYGDVTFINETEKVLIYQRKYFDEVMQVTLNKENWNYEIVQLN